jgi:hypothetical protein
MGILGRSSKRGNLRNRSRAMVIIVLDADRNGPRLSIIDASCGRTPHASARVPSAFHLIAKIGGE